jgi:multicomponent Na+:H+ antiporter subunit D
MPDDHSTAWLIVPIVGPLSLALAAFVLGGRWCGRLGLAAAVPMLASTVAVTLHVCQDGPQFYRMGNWLAPLGITLYADGLSCAMLWMTAVVGAAVSIYALEYFSAFEDDAGDSSPGGYAMFWPLWLILWSALNALFLSRDVFNLYVTLELLTLAAIGLVVLDGKRAAVEAALRYLLAAVIGSLLYLAGIAVLYGFQGTLDIDSLSAGLAAGLPSPAGSHVLPEAIAAGTELPTGGGGELPAAGRWNMLHPGFSALLLVMMGLMLKTALFPFHFWLPAAHSSAPAPVSALLSALVVKGSFYILLRLWFDLFPDFITQPVSMIPTVLGSAAILWGALQALFAERLKMLIAYSTVAQLGYLLLVFGLARPNTGAEADQAVWSACVLFALSHATSKAALFLAAGAILRAHGDDRVGQLWRVGGHLPVTFFAIGVASVSLMGLPPSGTFMAKWILLKAALEGGHFGLAIVMSVGGLLTAAYLFRVLAAAFSEDKKYERADPDHSTTFKPVPKVLEYSCLALALASLLLGLAAAPMIKMIVIGSPWSPLSGAGCGS